MEQETENKVFFNSDKLITDSSSVVGMTKEADINKNTLKGLTYMEFQQNFAINEYEEVYFYRSNDEIKYDRNVVENAITTLIDFVNLKRLSKKKVESEKSDIMVYFNEKEPMPIVFVYNKRCILVAPRT